MYFQLLYQKLLLEMYSSNEDLLIEMTHTLLYQDTVLVTVSVLCVQ